MAKREALEISFSSIAAIGGTLAAVSGFVAAFLEMQRSDLEKIPAIHLACQPEYRLAELAQSIKPPDEVLLLTESGGQWIHVGGRLPATAGGAAPVAPDPFARCEVKNFGRLPLLDIRIPLELKFSADAGPAPKVVKAEIDIPGLSADTSYEFSMLNGTSETLSYTFARTADLTRVDGGKAAEAPLFMDERTLALETQPIHAQAAAPPARAATVILKDFAFEPAELHVKAGQTVTFANDDQEAHAIVADDKSFASGAIDPRATWRHAFASPGRYRLHCDYHPYMHATIIAT